MATTIVHSNRMPYHLGKDRAGTAPGSDDFFITLLVHRLNLLKQFRLNEWAFF
jgi:hypothetical protein